MCGGCQSDPVALSGLKSGNEPDISQPQAVGDDVPASVVVIVDKAVKGELASINVKDPNEPE